MASWFWQPVPLTPAAAEPETVASHLVRVPFKPFARSRYLTHSAQDENAPAPPPDVPDGGSSLHVVPVWDGFRLARASRLYYQSHTDVGAPPEPDTLAPHLVRVPFKPFRPNRYILTTRRDDTAPPEPPGGPSHPPRGRPFRRDGNLGFEDGARYRRNRYIWNGSVETLQVQPADTPTPFRARVRFQGYRQQNRHVFHYYYTQPVAPPVGGFRAGWADDSTITINARRIDRGVIV